MLISTIIPVRFCHIPARAVVQAVYATAPAPHSSDQVRVRVLNVHTLAGRSKVATVQTLSGRVSWQVWVFTLSNISAFITEEVT